MFGPSKRDLETIKNFYVPQLRKSVEECSENTPSNATYAMMRLVQAYKADIKFTNDPSFKEIDTLVKKFSNECACNKIGRFKGQKELSFQY